MLDVDKIKIIQVKLRYQNTVTVRWVDFSKGIKKNSRIYLKGDNREWLIEDIYGAIDRSILYENSESGGVIND